MSGTVHANQMDRLLSCVVLGVTLGGGSMVLATDMTNPVFPAALDQPRINAYVKLPGAAEPLSADLGGLTFNITAFFDTGASGVMLSDQTAGLLEVPRQTSGGKKVVYSDVGVAGSENFYVSVPLEIGLAKFTDDADVDNLDTYTTTYNQTFGPMRVQIANPPASGNPLLEGLDVFGMPTMAGKVVVMDPKPVDAIAETGDFFLGDTMRTYVYNPGTPFNPATAGNEPGIPQTNRHVALSYASFERFTQIRLEDDSVTPPALSDPLSETEAAPLRPLMRSNPFIGPNPVLALDPGAPVDNTPGITVTYTNAGTQQSVTGSWLLDTGAAASILSTDQAGALGVTVDESGDTPVLRNSLGQIIPDQFTLTIAGIGGERTIAGFYLDTLVLPTVEGDPIVFHDAPVAVGDITVQDPVTGQTLTLDGIFGMNFLVSSAELTGDILNPVGALSPGNFNWIVFDEPNGLLGLDLKAIPEPGAMVLLSALPLAILRRRRVA